MTNPYYVPSGTPGTGAPGSSAPMRSEFAAIQAGFNLLPPFTGLGGCAVVVNALGSALVTTTGQLALAGNLATTGAFNTTLAQTASVTLTLPAVSGTLATLSGAEILSNKTLASAALGTPSSGNLVNCTLPNLTGPVTSVGTVTSIAQTGTGSTFAMSVSPTFSGKVTVGTSSTSGAGLNIPHGIAPTSPANGDTWTTTAGLFVEINGATVGPIQSYYASQGSQTTGFSAVAGNDYQNDVTGGDFTMTLPATPGNQSRIRFQLIGTSGLTIGLNGSNWYGGTTNPVLYRPGVYEIEYTSSAQGWTITSALTEFGYFNSNFAAIAGGDHIVDCTGGNVTATMPSASGTYQSMRFRKFGTGILTFSGTVNGSSGGATMSTEGIIDCFDSGSTRGWV